MENLKNKNILFLCKESSSYPVYFLLEQLLTLNNKIAVYFFMAPETMYKSGELNASTYYAFLKNKNIEIFTFNDYAKKIFNYVRNSIDFSFLSQMEYKFSHYKNLYQQLISSQFTSKTYHFRNYIGESNLHQKLLFLEYNYKMLLHIFNEFKPDLILDYDDAELPRTIINELAYYFKVPYININHPRIENFKIPTFNLGTRKESFFLKKYQEFNLISDLSSELEYIKNFNKQANIMPIEYKGSITSQYKPDKILLSIKKVLYMIKYFIKQDFKNFNLKKKSKFLFPNSINYIYYYYKVEVLRRKLSKLNRYFHLPNINDKYFYMPLHLIPESTTFVKAPYFVNELTIIEAISKSLPIDCILYVKEHQAMIGERSLDFYKKVNSFQNVKMVQYNFYKDPKPWIERSLGVISITGTSALEASFLGKPSLLFGLAPFYMINSIHNFESFSNLNNVLNKMKNYKFSDKDFLSLAAYIKTVKFFGFEIKYKYLMAKGEELVKKKLEPDKEFLEEIYKLLNFYNKSLDIYKEFNETSRY